MGAGGGGRGRRVDGAGRKRFLGEGFVIRVVLGLGDGAGGGEEGAFRAGKGVKTAAWMALKR